MSAPVFAAYGDANSYFAVPGATFEGGLTDWTLTDASVVAGDDGANIGGVSGTQSLMIAADGSATSASLCTDASLPSFRFFAQAAPGASQLTVSAVWTTNSGQQQTTQVGQLTAGQYGSWTLTAPLSLSSPSGMNGLPTRLVFSADSAGAWSIDDVYVDPYAKGKLLHEPWVVSPARK